jgi:hypothetical protein
MIALDLLHVVHVERGHAVTMLGRVVEQLAQRYQCHEGSLEVILF